MNLSYKKGDLGLNNILDRRADRMMSVVIPLGLTVVGGIVLTRGLYSMYTGTNKLE